MNISLHASSFKEFYYLEESLQEDLINKWNELKNNLSSSSSINVDTLKREIKERVLKLKQLNSGLLKPFAKTLVDDKFTKNIFSNPTRNVRLIAWLVGLLFLSGASTLKDNQTVENPPEYNEVKLAVDNGVFNTPAPVEQTKQLSQQIAEEIRWGRFENRKDFVNQVKKFESDSGTPLGAYFDRTQTSIGFGTKAKKGESKLTPETAHNRLIDELEEHETLAHNIIKAVKPKWKLNQNQWDALTDMSFNIGSGELTKMLHKCGTLKALGEEASTYIHATKKDGTKEIAPGLIKRRVWENQLLGNKPKPKPESKPESKPKKPKTKTKK